MSFKKFFKISLYAMRLNKSHPAEKRNLKWLCFFLFYHSLFAVVFCLIVYNIIYINMANKDFDEICKNGVLSVVFIIISFQYCIMLWKQEQLLILMNHMKNDFEYARHLPIDEREIMIKYAKKGVFVCKQWFALSCAACGIFPVKNVILLTYHFLKGDPKLIPMYDLIYPGVIEENKENIFVFLAIYATLLFYGMYSMCMSIGFVPLGPIFMLHACGQLEIVEQKISVLFKDKFNEALIEAKLKEIVKQLHYIYSFVEQVRLSFTVAYELTLRSTSIMLPVACYEVIEAFHKGNGALEFTTFIVGAILISSLPCYYSELLMEKGVNIRHAMYSCGWEKMNSRPIRKTILIVMARALKPLAIRTLFRTVCLEALTDLFQQSYGIFNLMNALWK